MPPLRLTTAITRVRTIVLAPDPNDTDGCLLARFVRDRDDVAFRELVRRLGPMVLGVCRRVTRDAHLAEDAFQAAFLILARRAAEVVPREAVRGWVHGVAVRTARKARAMSARRTAREITGTWLPELPVLPRDEPEADLLLALDEEVAALPEHLRAVVLLCEIEGLGRKDAAVRLGMPEGTLSSRLAKARRVLADRLRRRGFALCAAGLGTVLARSASAVPPRLVSAAAAIAAGSAPVPVSVASLSHGVFRAMFLTKLTVGLGALVLAALGWTLPERPSASAAPVPMRVFTAASAAPVPKRVITPISATNAADVRSLTELNKRPTKITRGPGKNELTFLDWENSVEVVDDANFRAVRTLTTSKTPVDFAMSPGGKFQTWTERNKKNYTVFETATNKSFDIEIGDFPGSAAFSPDGKLIAIGNTVWDRNARGSGSSEMQLFDVTGKLIRTLDKTGPGGLTPVFSPDGKILAVGNRNHETLLFEVATGKLLHTLDKKMTQEIAFSPDGKTLATGYVDGEIGLWDVATGKQLCSELTGGKEVYSVDWSPKGDVLVTSGREGKIVLWEPQRLTKLKELDAPIWVIQVRFTADGTRLLSSSSSDRMAKGDRKVTVWGLADGAGK
jgi:RNA polymerase sigma factor (sigma-70 family)